MTPDERIQALRESLVRLRSLHRHLEHQSAARSREADARSRETAASFREIAAQFADLGQFINSLAHIAEAHEHRLDRPEGQ